MHAVPPVFAGLSYHLQDDTALPSGLAMAPQFPSLLWRKRSRMSGPTAAASEVCGGDGEDGRERLAFFLGGGPGLGNVLRPLPHVGSALTVLLALGAGILIERFIGLQSVLLVFMMAILASAILWGLLPSLLACVLSVLAFNFFLVPPVYTFAIADPDNAVALFFFLVVAVIVSNLTAATRSQIVIARSRARTTAALYAFSRKLAGIGTLDDLLWATAYQVSSMLAVRTVVLMPDKDGRRLAIASVPLRRPRGRPAGRMRRGRPRADGGRRSPPRGLASTRYPPAVCFSCR